MIREDVQPILRQLVADAGGDLPQSESYAVVIRICLDFYKAIAPLAKIEDLKPYDLNYLNGAIRSGMDFYFDVLYDLKSSTVEIPVPIAWSHYETFSDFKAAYRRELDKLEKGGISLSERASALIVLIRMKLMFLGNYFY